MNLWDLVESNFAALHMHIIIALNNQIKLAIVLKCNEYWICIVVYYMYIIKCNQKYTLQYHVFWIYFNCGQVPFALCISLIQAFNHCHGSTVVIIANINFMYIVFHGWLCS